jgi:adenylate cyclase
MPTDSAERKLAAILSADVVGYSRLMAEDEAATVRTLSDYREEIDLLVRQHRGRVVDTAGDSLLAEFPTATGAVECAVEVQRVLGVRNIALPSERRMEFRIGIHLGEVRVEGERIYGDGVNVAARLEGLADPGGICISGTVQEQVRRKLHFVYEDLGKQELKNIPDPVHAYRVRLEPQEASLPDQAPGMGALTVPGFGGRPAIAVLPFDNLSGDPEQEYFADGIAEDLITRLSALRDLPVIARNSSFTYKGKAVDVKQVSRELGVQYIVEGSVRKVGDRVRIGAQLIEATTGAHAWAESYDRELRDIFALQDEITQAIVASMIPEFWRSERERIAHLEPRDLDAWDCAQRGWWHFWKQSSEDDNVAARRFFERAIELDPHFALAFVGLAMTHSNDLFLQWTDSPERSVGELVRAADRAVALDAGSWGAQLAFGVASSVTGQQEKATAALELAVELNPSSAGAYTMLGITLATAGNVDQGITNIEKAIRLSPRDPLLWWSLFSMAFACFVAKRYEEALDWAKQSLQRRPGWAGSYRVLAASYAHLDQLEEARTALDESLRLQPDFSPSTWRLFVSSADPGVRDRYIDGLRKAGLKE